jgi:hypothetical protein
MDSSKRSRRPAKVREPRRNHQANLEPGSAARPNLLAPVLALLGAVGPLDAFDLSGRLLAGNGTGISGATVTLRSGATTRTATSDATGTYSLAGLANGSWTVKPAKTSTFFAPESILLYSQTSTTRMGFVGGSFPSTPTGADIGAVSATGSSAVQPDGSVLLTSGGSALGGGLQSLDALHFHGKGISGDGDLVAKVGTISGGGENAQIGLMFREATAPDSRFTALVFRPHQPGAGDHVMYISRMTKGYDTPAGGCRESRCDAVDATRPVWLRIRRQANDFLYYWSTDGAGWIYLGTATVAMPQNLLAGAVLLGSDGTTTQATVDQMTFTPNATPSVTVSTSATTAAVGTSLTLSATANDPDGTVSSVQFFVNGSRVGISSAAPYQTTWATTGLSAGNYLVTAKATDDKGAYRYAVQKTITLTGTVPARPVALLVAKSTTLAGGDLVLGDRLNALGFSVVVKTDAAVAATDTTGKALVVVAPSAVPANLGTKLKSVKKAVVVANPALYAGMSMTGSVQNTDWGFASSRDSVNVTGCSSTLLNWSLNGGVNRNNGTANCHELTGALFGKRQVQKVAGNMAWAKPGSAAKVAATLDNDATKATVFGYDPGAAMASGFAAPGRRAGIWMDTASAKSLSDAGRSLFDAAVFWAAQMRTPITKKVMVINYEPILTTKGNQLMHVYKGWADPHESAREYLSDLTEASGGYVRWQIVDFKDVNGMPPNNTGYVWNEANILAAIDNAVYPPGGADYLQIVATWGIDAMVRAGQLDEVVMYGPGGSGFNESRMLGQNPYFVNGDPTYIANTPNFVIMGLNSDRGTAEALESFGHRAESIMSNVMGWNYSDCEGYPDFRQRNGWEQLASIQKTVVPGQPTGIGNAHYSPVTPQDYDWSARWYFPDGPWLTANTFADDWAANYPYFKGTTNIVDARTWDPQVGTAYAQNDRGFKRWWLGHMPRVMGNSIDGTPETRRAVVAANGTGYSNNWWDYMVDFNKRPESQGPQAQSCRESYRSPDVATGLAAVPGDGQVSLTWNTAFGATDYSIEKSMDGTTWSTVFAVNGPSATVYALANDVPVSFRIKASNEVGPALPSAVVTVAPRAYTEPCSPAMEISGGHSGNFNTTGGVCFKTTSSIVGWGCANFDGRIMKVNGVQMSCGQLPVPAPVGGYNYFEATAGTYPWANFWWW